MTPIRTLATSTATRRRPCKRVSFTLGLASFSAGVGGAAGEAALPMKDDGAMGISDMGTVTVNF